jgi:MFS transporter (putative signal transducer)
VGAWAAHGTERKFFATPGGRKLLFASLYLSEGAPIGFIWWALPTRLRAAGIPVEDITALTALLVLPWVFKFAWAPLVDALRSRQWNLPAWILAAQVLMGLCLLPLAFLSIHEQYALVVPLLFLHAFAAATQDASIDALSVAVVPESERGAINGWMQAGMLAGRSLFGGGALLLGERFGQDAVIFLLVAAVWVSMLLVFAARRELNPPLHSQGVAERWRDFRSNMLAVLKLRTTWLGLAFAGVGGAAFEAVGAVAGPFLIDRGFSTSEVGWFFGIPVVLGMMGGALAGGYASDRFGRVRCVTAFLITIACIIVVLAVADAMVAGEQRLLLLALLAFLYIAIGMFTAGSYALFMDLTDVRVGATQFSTYMGATNGCEAWSSLAVGRLIPVLGYPAGFVVMALVSLLAFPVLRLMKPSAHA